MSWTVVEMPDVNVDLLLRNVILNLPLQISDALSLSRVIQFKLLHPSQVDTKLYHDLLVCGHKSIVDLRMDVVEFKRYLVADQTVKVLKDIEF